MQFRHGAFVIDLPGDWEDRSTLCFMAPPPADLSLPTQSPVAETTELVSISFVDVDVEVPITAREFLAAESEQLSTEPSYDLVDEGAFQSPLGDAWRYVHRLDVDGLLVRQVNVAARVGDIMVVATASFVDEKTDFVDEQINTILSSLRVEVAQ